MSHENRFNRKKVKTEIDRLISEVNKNSIAEELKHHKRNINVYKIIGLNSKTIISLGEMIKATNDNVHAHSEIMSRIGKTFKKLKKYLIIAIGLGTGAVLMSIVSLILLFLQ